MDIIAVKSRIMEILKKYKYACVILLAGILLMILPETPKKETMPQTQVQKQTENFTIEGKLEETLSRLNGAGKVKVMLTIEKGEQTVYQTDSTYSHNENDTDTKTQTILITGSDRNETGLIYQINPPIYLGAIVLAQGADNPVVKLSIVEAVSNVTGLGADRITVLKMQ